MFWTAGWGAILGFSSGVVGIAGATVTTVLIQRSTTKRELMLADRAWEEKLFIGQRDAITDLILFLEEFDQPASASIDKLMDVVVANYPSDVKVKFQPMIDQLKDELADNLRGPRAPRFLLGERIKQQTLGAAPNTENLVHIATEMRRRWINVDLLVADVDLKDALEKLMKSWGEFAPSWYALRSLTETGATKKPSEDNFPQERNFELSTYAHSTSYSKKEVKGAAHDFVRRMRA